MTVIFLNHELFSNRRCNGHDKICSQNMTWYYQIYASNVNTDNPSTIIMIRQLVAKCHSIRIFSATRCNKNNKKAIGQTCPSCGPNGGAATACPAGIFVFRYGGWTTFSTAFFTTFVATFFDMFPNLCESCLTQKRRWHNFHLCSIFHLGFTQLNYTSPFNF